MVTNTVSPAVHARMRAGTGTARKDTGMQITASGPPDHPTGKDAATRSAGTPRPALGLRAKMALVLFTTLLVTLTVNSLLTLRTQERDILEETDRRGREVSQFLAHHIANDVVGYAYHAIELTLAEVVTAGDIVYVRVDNALGNTMATAGALPRDPASAKPYQAEIRWNDEYLGRLTLQLSTARLASQLDARQRDTLIRQMVAIVAVLLVEFAVLSVVIIRPLTRVSRVIGRNLRAADDSLQPIPLTGTDELGELARGFNALQERLTAAQQQLKGRIDVTDRELHAANLRLAMQAQELRVVNRELEQLSVTDPLTGLYNRRYFVHLMESEIEVSIRNDETISILLLDIDRLRDLNECLGHRAGDEIIREVAQRIAAHIRPTDVACRYGGDEFFILCRRATIATAVTFADDLQRTIAETPVTVQGENVRVRVTIGAATIPGVHPVADPDGFFRCADEALRQGKQAGRPVMHYSMLERTARAGAI